MTKNEWLAGEETELQRKIREEWNKYNISQEKIDEIEALLEMECYDGPTGDS